MAEKKREPRDREWCVHLPNELHRPTKVQAAAEGRLMYRLIEDALRDYLENHKK